MIRIEDLERKTTPGIQRVTFTTRDINELDQVIAKYNGKQLYIEIKPIRQKRSQNANSYAWVLCDKIAQALHSTKEEVYRRAVREVGVFHDGKFAYNDVPDMRSAWENNGIGWFLEVFDDFEDAGMRWVRFYHGSSLYNTEQMSRLIDWLIEEAKEIGGIETLPPDELLRMKNAWGE